MTRIFREEKGLAKATDFNIIQNCRDFYVCQQD